MTSRERFMKSVRGEPVDRLFRNEFQPWPSTRDRWVKEGYPADADFRDYFDLDPVVIPQTNLGLVESPLYPLIDTRIIEETDDYVVSVGSDGITKKTFNSASNTSMPQFLRFPVTSRKDWDGIKRHLDPGDALSRIGDAASVIEQCSDPNVPVLVPVCGAFGHPRNLLGDEGLSYVIYDDPDLLHEILDNWREVYEEVITTLTSIIRVDGIIIWEDMCYKNGPLISPNHFRTFMLPRWERLIQVAQECGIECISLDSDGDVLKMIPLWVEAGVNAIMPFEVQAGMDVVKIREEFCSSFCIMGGIDKRALAKNKESIEEEVARILPHFVNSGRYIPHLDHLVPSNVSFDNFNYYLECVRRYEQC
jgi:uroporphyrinogen-III decarboxylase